MSWEGNHRSGIALATHHGLKLFIQLWAQGLHKEDKKHLKNKNVGPIRHNEPPHAHSPDVASSTVARRLRIDVHDDNDNA